MKTKKGIVYTLMLCTVALVLGSCTNKEQKAFDDAMQSRELAQLRQFISSFPQADPLLLDSAKVVLAEWVRDSADYAQLKQMKDVVERYGAEITYMDQHPEGLYIDSVNQMFQSDEGPAAEMIARQEAIEEHLQEYRKSFDKRVYYSDPTHFIVLTVPDDKGKGQGMMGDGWLTYYDFHYAINLDDMDDEDIQCEMDKYDDAHFTLSLYDKTLYFQAKGDLERYDGEIDESLYKDFLERVAKINKGEDVYGNPSAFITLDE